MIRRPAEHRSDPGPVERFRPPVVTAHEIVRLRLLDRLTAALGDADAARITLVRGPAGFGKTTLLAQAYRQVVARGQKAVWLDCSELDADPNHFLDSLYAAAVSIGMDGHDLEFTLADFAQRLARIDAAVYVFLDEFERLAGTPVEDMIERLAAVLPRGAHLILASRQGPRTWFLKRELRGLATTIEALDLRLTGSELQALLGERFNAEEVGHIQELTEGWPMAVQLTRLRSRDTVALRELLGTLERGGLGLFEYLAERVVQSLSAEQQAFLRDTSILPFVNPLAANALMERDDGYALLSGVMHLQPIVTVTGDAELTIRLHPLFRQFMRDQLARSGQHRERELQQRAAAFFAQRGRTPEAVQHALEAGDPALAVSVLDRAGGEELIFTIGPRKVQAILAALPPASLELSLRLRFMQLLMVAVDGRSTVVAVLAQRFLASLDADGAVAQAGLSPQWAEHARGVTALVTAFLQDLYAGCAHGAVANALRMDWYCRRHFATDESHLGIVLAFEVLLFARCGNVSDARRCLEDYHALCERNSFAPNLPSINPQRGMIEFLGGHFDKAQMLFERCAELRLDHFAEPEMLLAQLSKALLTMLIYERGRLEDALSLSEGLRTDMDASLAEIVALSYRTRIVCSEKLRGRDIADAVLEEGLLEARKRDAQRLIRYLQAVRVEVLHRRGATQDSMSADLAAVHACLNDELGRQDPSWLFLDQCSRAIVPVLVDQQRHEEAAAIAQRVHDIAHAQGRSHLQAVALILLARARMQHDRNGATETLRAALALTSETGAIQPYLDLAPQLGQIMVAAVAGRSAPGVADHVRTMLRVLEGDPAAGSDAWRSLSQRERDILLVLAEHASTKAAARALGLAPETVKHHLKRIYLKLGVHTREEALAQVARLGN